MRSSNRNRLGCLTPTGLFAALITILAVTGATFATGGGLFSPGGLNARQGPPLGQTRSHADLGRQCDACHSAPWEAEGMSSRCLDCHIQIQADLKDPGKLHGALVKTNASANCRDCHTEHKGSDGMLTRLDIVNFPHEVTGYSLKAHAFQADGKPFTCDACHGQEYESVDAAQCDQCHTRLASVAMTGHRLSFGAECFACHDGVDAYGKTFDHNSTAFKLEGRHAEKKNGQIACQGCHQGQTTMAAVKQTPVQCEACHLKDDAHEGKMGTDCAACHTPQDWDQSTFDHAIQTDFKLEGKHQEISCQDCHTQADLKNTPTGCADCHAKADPHQGKLVPNCQTCHSPEGWKPARYDHNLSTFKLTGKHTAAACTGCHQDNVFAGTPANCAACHKQEDSHQGKLGLECQACHTTEGWKPSTFDHNQSEFKLTGKHASAACADCHQDKTFAGVSSGCASCHSGDDAHQGKLGGNCQSCHSTSAWKPSTFDHSQSAFKLTGAHQQAACTDCHQDKTFAGASSNCASCHSGDDAHQGKLGGSCQSCHSTSAWKPATFNHNQAAFKLTGAHLQAACSACHQDKTFAGASFACASCHSGDDAHQGSLGTDCALCHSTSAWKPATFNHAKSAFPLTGAHASVQCGACHANQTFKGTPTNCYACHSGDDQHVGKFGKDCAACHVTASWSQVTFDHKKSGFPLTGAHTSVVCTQCHANGFSGTPKACAACHAEPTFHAGLLGSDCGACHTTSAWRPGQYNRAHNFPMRHGNANSCQTCHPSGLTSYTCYSCHDQNETEKKHREENVSDLNNCTRCHANGEKGDD